MSHTKLATYAYLVSALALTGLLGACSADEPTVILNNGRSGSGGTAGAPSAGGGSGGGTGGSSGASNEPACVEEPEAPEDFLARCTESTCRSFDNAERLGLFQPGQPLPEVP